MENNLTQDILDKLTKTCPCKVITRAKIKDAIKAGAHTVEDVAKATGACTGGCKGYRCKPLINDLIRTHLETE